MLYSDHVLSFPPSFSSTEPYQEGLQSSAVTTTFSTTRKQHQSIRLQKQNEIISINVYETDKKNVC